MKKIPAKYKATIKFSIPYLMSTGLEDYYVKGLYDFDKKSDMAEYQNFRGLKSRMKKYARFQAFAIIFENKRYLSKLPIEVAALQSMITGVSSWEDSIQDEVIVPRYLIQAGDVTEQFIFDNITNDETSEKWVSSFLEDQPAFWDEDSKKWSNPSLLYSAQKRVSRFYSQRIKDLSELAHDLYVTKRREVSWSQAEDLMLAVLMKRKDFEAVRKKFSGRDFLEEAYRRLGKLSIIASTMAVMDNTISWRDRRKLNMEDVNRALHSFYTFLTNLNQAGKDDLGRLLTDVKELSPNIFTFYILQERDEVNEDVVREALEPKMIEEILNPLLEGTYEQLRELKRLNFTFPIHKIATEMAVDDISQNMVALEEDLGVRLDVGSWTKKVKELKDKYS